MTLSAGMPRPTISAAQPLADGGYRIRVAEHSGLQRPGGAVAQAALAAGAVVHRRVFPEGSALVDHGQAQLSPGPQGGQAIERRRVGMEDVRPLAGGHLDDAAGQGLHHCPLAQQRQPVERVAAGGGAVEAQAVHLFFRLAAGPLLQ